MFDIMDDSGNAVMGVNEEFLKEYNDSITKKTTMKTSTKTSTKSTTKEKKIVEIIAEILISVRKKWQEN